jgi:hypothetical protein
MSLLTSQPETEAALVPPEAARVWLLLPSEAGTTVVAAGQAFLCPLSHLLSLNIQSR